MSLITTNYSIKFLKIKINTTAYNTVGIINKLVMVFALTTAFNTAFNTLINPDTRICSQFNLCTMSHSVVSMSVVPRHCSSAPYYGTATYFNINNLFQLHRDTRILPTYCTRTAKTTPYPLTHRDYFVAKDYRHPPPDGLRVTLTNHTAKR
jgi:hypothetical protein